jgi:hypothetical protein
MCFEKRYSVDAVGARGTMDELERGQGHVRFRRRLYSQFWKTWSLSIPQQATVIFFGASQLVCEEQQGDKSAGCRTRTTDADKWDGNQEGPCSPQFQPGVIPLTRVQSVTLVPLIYEHRVFKFTLGYVLYLECKNIQCTGR